MPPGPLAAPAMDPPRPASCCRRSGLCCSRRSGRSCTLRTPWLPWCGLPLAPGLPGWVVAILGGLSDVQNWWGRICPAPQWVGKPGGRVGIALLAAESRGRISLACSCLQTSSSHLGGSCWCWASGVQGSQLPAGVSLLLFPFQGDSPGIPSAAHELEPSGAGGTGAGQEVHLQV